MKKNKEIEINKIILCNRTLYKLHEQQVSFPMDIGFRIYKDMKLFDEVEEYVFSVMEMTFGEDFDISRMNDEQKLVYDRLMGTKVEINDIQMLKRKRLEKNDKIMVSIQDIENMEIILE